MDRWIDGCGKPQRYFDGKRRQTTYQAHALYCSLVKGWKVYHFALKHSDVQENQLQNIFTLVLQ